MPVAQGGSELEGLAFRQRDRGRRDSHAGDEGYAASTGMAKSSSRRRARGRHR
jgi:hypothetical protein